MRRAARLFASGLGLILSSMLGPTALGAQEAEPSSREAAGSDYTVLFDERGGGPERIHVHICFPASACPQNFSQLPVGGGGASPGGSLPPWAGGPNGSQVDAPAGLFSRRSQMGGDPYRIRSGNSELDRNTAQRTAAEAERVRHRAEQAEQARLIAQQRARRDQLTEQMSAAADEALRESIEIRQVAQLEQLLREEGDPHQARHEALLAGQHAAEARRAEAERELATVIPLVSSTVEATAAAITGVEAATREAAQMHNTAYADLGEVVDAVARDGRPLPGLLSAPSDAMPARSAMLAPFATPPSSEHYALLVQAHDYWESADASRSDDGPSAEAGAIYLDLAALSIGEADRFLADEHAAEGVLVLEGVMALLDDVFDLDQALDHVGAGSTFVAGIIHGSLGLTARALPGYQAEWHAGTLVGGALGLLLDTLSLAGLAQTVASTLGGGGLIMATGAALLPAAATLAAGVAVVGGVAGVVLIGQHAATTLIAMQNGKLAEGGALPTRADLLPLSPKMFRDGAHFKKHGRSMGYSTIKQYVAAAKQFLVEALVDSDAKFVAAKWNGTGQYGGEWQVAITNKGRTLVVHPGTKKMVTFYEGDELRGLIRRQSI